MSKLRLAVGIPAYGDRLHAPHAKMWMEFGNTLGGSAERFELVMFATADVNPVDRARNQLLTNAEGHRADWLLMIDADTWVESTDPHADAGFLLLRMISEADRAGMAIAAAPVMRRAMGESNELLAYRYDDGRYVPLQRTPRMRGWERVDAVATACIAINLRRLGNARFRFTDELSEDLEFCRQVRETGGKIFVDGRIRTGHMSRPFPLYNLED